MSNSTQATGPTLHNVSNLAALGVEWAGETGSRHSLYTVRGSRTLRYAFRTVGEQRWSDTTVDAPQRFGFDLDNPPTSVRAFLAIAHAFVAPGPQD